MSKAKNIFWRVFDLLRLSSLVIPMFIMVDGTSVSLVNLALKKPRLTIPGLIAVVLLGVYSLFLNIKIPYPYLDPQKRPSLFAALYVNAIRTWVFWLVLSPSVFPLIYDFVPKYSVIGFSLLLFPVRLEDEDVRNTAGLLWLVFSLFFTFFLPWYETSQYTQLTGLKTAILRGQKHGYPLFLWPFGCILTIMMAFLLKFREKEKVAKMGCVLPFVWVVTYIWSIHGSFPPSVNVHKTLYGIKAGFFLSVWLLFYSLMALSEKEGGNGLFDIGDAPEDDDGIDGFGIGDIGDW